MSDNVYDKKTDHPDTATVKIDEKTDYIPPDAAGRPAVLPASVVKTEEEIFIDEAVKEINRITFEKVYDAYSKIGKYVLKTFFDNDPEKASSRNPHKSASYAKLCKRDDLPHSAISLGRMLRVACFEKELENAGIDVKVISFTNKVILARIKDKDQRIIKAKEISQADISSRQLEAKLKEECQNSKKLKTITIKNTISNFVKIKNSITKIKFPEIKALINKSDIEMNTPLFNTVKEIKTQIELLMNGCEEILKLDPQQNKASKKKTNKGSK